MTSAGEVALHDLNEHGISLQGAMIYDWSKEIDSEDSEAGFGRYSFDLTMPVDGHKLWGLKGSAGLVRLRHHLNNFGDDCAGEDQLFSNIDASPRTTLYEIWIEQHLFNEKLRLKFGKVDANTEFATVQTASDFLNSSMGYSPTIIAFPTYPEPKLGFNAFFHPTLNDSLGVGVFQTASAGTLSIIEPGHSWRLGRSENPGRISVGYWRLGGNLVRFDGRIADETHGFYSVVEHMLWRDPSQQRNLSAFLQLGFADGRVSSIERHIGAGTVVQGIVPKRSQDSIGIATTWVRFSSQPAAAFDLPTELILESYYKIAITKHLSLVQDFQFVHHPGGLRSNPDCPILTPRLVITF